MKEYETKPLHPSLKLFTNFKDDDIEEILSLNEIESFKRISQ